MLTLRRKITGPQHSTQTKLQKPFVEPIAVLKLQAALLKRSQVASLIPKILFFLLLYASPLPLLCISLIFLPLLTDA